MEVSHSEIVLSRISNYESPSIQQKNWKETWFIQKKLHGKSSIQLLHFYNEEKAKRLHDFGITEIAADEVILKPYLLK